ncbi:ArsA family ATPase [Aciditerrimonas ferrireducens]|uniref:ArsA family ATPase n=1 Tax=Aciditerrimonas ferrireducens TaxID=667306 RepID=A0ABV6C6M2_9ACTN
MSPPVRGTARGRPSPAPSLGGLLASKEIVVACGPGGVGKTTTAAAAAATAAVRSGGRVLVLTVDPARRLADALGVKGIGNEAVRVPPQAFAAAGVQPKGELWAAMLDTKQSWDDLVRRHAPDARTREQILANPLYRNISARFVQSHDYIAMERLYELHAEGCYDLLVVDTPPSRNALDFLDAPARMADFFSSRLLRWLIVPYRSRLVNVASRPFYQVADRILGSQFLSDIAEFFILFQSMYDGFVTRAKAVERLLADRRTSFLVVSTLEPTPLREAETFVGALEARGLHLGALVLNKVLPPFLLDPAGAQAAEAFVRDHERLAKALAGELPGIPKAQAAQLARVLQTVGRSFSDYRLVAEREQEQRAELSRAPEVLVSVPSVDRDVVDLAGLLALGERLWPR